ncbi:secretion/DNA translocation related CpaE-like protein [Prauserella sediminis]|uniref:Secretion/DNA translocation related CpaE-like protein n=1 Tax=Prauserella sediminis TaxID=577680 RepID=A0A839XL07_9PSEU|nr:septum site-determining protein Ssd [Prauserella sediminis]MBB3663277.1 secretion/DNA translocation related CpaE-like protein [Prauserella sediminis]
MDRSPESSAVGNPVATDAMAGSDRRPLVVAREGRVLDEIRRHAAAVDCDLAHAADLDDAEPYWHEAPLVLVDEDVAPSTRVRPRRDDVVLVCGGKPPQSVWRRAVVLGAREVVTLPDTEGVLLTSLADVVEQPSVDRGRVVAVLGGRGGAGSSVLAAAVSVSAARAGGKSVLLDCDPLGGGIDLVLGAELQTGVRWPDVRIHGGRVAMSALDDALPVAGPPDGPVALLSCDRDGGGPAPETVEAVLRAGVRAGRTVVCDLPRDPGPCGRRVLSVAELVVVVVPAELRACVAASRVLERLGDVRSRVRVLVRGPSPDGLSARDVAGSVGVPLLGWLPADRRIAKTVERGSFNPRRRGPLGVAARTVLRELAAG